MFVLPDKVSAAYNRFMAQQQPPESQQNYFRKWLRYYVDFWRKYEKPWTLSIQVWALFAPSCVKKNNLKH